MQEKMELVKKIKEKIGYYTGMNFHQEVCKILKYKCEIERVEWVAPKQLGGDGGVDFLIKTSNIYYAIDGESSNKTEEYKKKLESDISKMKKNIVSSSTPEWTGKINEVIAVFQTFDQELPNAFSGRNKYLKNLEAEMGVQIKVYNLEMLLNTLDISVLRLLKIEYNIILESKSNFLTELQSFMDLSTGISEEANYSYKRKSSIEKIEENKLNMDYINRKINECRWTYGLDTWLCKRDNFSKFESIKEIVIDVYETQQINFNGQRLLLNVITSIKEDYNIEFETAENIVIYIFDHCDIF